MKKIITTLLFVSGSFISSTFAITTYTWVGGTSTSFTTNANWSPNTGHPGSTDNVIIGNYSGSVPTLAANASVANFTITTKSMSVATFTLTITGTALFSGGTINGNATNGAVSCSGASTTFGTVSTGPTILVNITVVSADITDMRNATFGGTTNLTKTGGVSNTWDGNDTYQGVTTITNSSTVPVYVGYNFPEIFNTNVTFNNSGGGTTSFLYVGSASSGNQFQGNTTFNNNTVATGATLRNLISVCELAGSTGIFSGTVTVNNTSAAGKDAYVRFALNGACTFNGNLILNNTTTGSPTTRNGIFFGFTSGSAGTTSLANGKTISITAFTSGYLYFQKFSQLDASTSQNITLTGISELYFKAGTTFNGNITATSPSIYFDGATLTGTNSFIKNGSVDNVSAGGNVFSNDVSFTNSGTGLLSLANTLPDDYNGNATFIQSGSGLLQPAYNGNNTFSKNISTVGTTTGITFGAGTGRVTMDGSSPQVLNGASAQKPTISRLTIATTSNATLTLNVPLDISADLTLSAGKIFTSATNILALTDESVTTSIGSSTSYIDGPMKYTCNSSSAGTLLLFPIGKGSDWRPSELTVQHASTTADTYTAELLNASARGLGYTIPATLDSVSSQHYWQIDRTTTGALMTAAVKFYYGSNDGVKTPSNLRLAKTNGSGTAWNDIGGAGTGSTTGNITSTVNFTTFSKFTLASDAITPGWNPLPIELLSFDAKPNDDDVEINWKTASEINNDFFNIEKSHDGQTFEDIGKLKGAGNSTTFSSYSLIDYSPYTDITYYRLKQTDFDGKFKYFKIISVSLLKDISTDLSLDVFPNPSNGSPITLAIKGSPDEKVFVSMVDASGSIRYAKNIVLNENGDHTRLIINKTDKLIPGTYAVIVTSNQHSISKKILID